MSCHFQGRSAEEKLGLILQRIGSIRARLNSLAWQRAGFGTLAWVIAGVTLVLTAAFVLEPLPFLATAIILGVLASVGIVETIRAAWRSRVNSVIAATIADDRAQLKGRLETIVQLHERPEPAADSVEPLRLWSYLIEETIAHQHKFVPAIIQRRSISRSAWGLVGSLVLAALLLPLIARQRVKQQAAAMASSAATADLDDLDLRPTEPEPDNDADVRGDPATLHQLESKVAAAGDAGSSLENSDLLGGLMNRVKTLADHLQRELTGRQKARLRINLNMLNMADPGGDANQLASRPGGQNLAQDNHDNKDGSGHSRENNASATQDQDENPQADLQAGLPPGSKPIPNPPPVSGNSATSPQSMADDNQSGGGGSAHGIGANPDTLFGMADAPTLGSRGFQISIEARPSNHGAEDSDHSYLSPKVRALLNPIQHPDQPIARTSVPEDDRAAVKRVFER